MFIDTGENMSQNEFSEIVFNPTLTASLIEYFTSQSSLETIQSEVKKMIDSGTVKPIIFSYLLTALQMMRMSKPGFTIADSTNLGKLRSCILIIYEDKDYAEQVTKQLFSFYIQTGNQIERNPALRSEILEMVKKSENG